MRNLALDHLNAVIDQRQVRPVSLGKINDLLQQALILGCIIADRCTANDRILPYVLQVDLSRGDIKFAVQPRQNWLDFTALLL